MRNNNKKIGIFVLLALLSLSNNAIADENIDYTLNQDFGIEKIKANKDTLSNAQDAINNKDFQTAITLLTGYINEKPKKYEAYKLRGDAYYALRRYNIAEKDYQSAIDLKTSDDKFMTNTKYVSAIVLGADKNEQRQNAELGDLYGALMYAQKAQNNPAYTTSYENAVKYNSHIYLPQPNKSEINKINCPQKYGKIINPQGIDTKIYGAISDIENGNYNEAVYKLQTVITEKPNYYLGHYLMGVALSELEKEDDAIKSFEKAISLNPYDFESYASLGRIYYSKAETKFSDSDAKKSIQYFNRALKLNKNCPTYYFYIGMNELQTGNTNVAIYNFDQALKINASDYNSSYYKLIAQYINGNYQDVVDGSTKLLLKHVSNYNSVLYLRALAYTKLNDTERALQDLNSIENNIEDIYNTDIKPASAREKSLESYTHYLKSEIQHSKGAGAASDNTMAYSNPIINRLANAQKAMEPYEKSLQNDIISLDDYNKFESFYSTSLPKLLESGAVITYEDIDNQYDYIRTTFADLGISFLYTDPTYKITTIKDYPYKKYSSKLPIDEQDFLSLRPESETKNVELAKTQNLKMKQSTPQAELLVQDGQQSLAQILALNELSSKSNTKPQSAEALQEIHANKNIDNSTLFKPETPDAENINTSRNIASGEIYESNTPSLNNNNSQKVKTILDEEKNIDSNIPIIRTNQSQITTETKTDENIKISTKTSLSKEENLNNSINSKQNSNIEPMKFNANEFKQTEDIEIKYKDVKPVTTIVATNVNNVNNQIDAQNKLAMQAKIDAENQLKQQKEEAKRLEEAAKEQLEAEKLAAKQAKIEAENQLRQQKEETKKLASETKEQLEAEKLAAKQAKIEAKNQLRQQKEEAKKLANETKEQLEAEKLAAKQAKIEAKNQLKQQKEEAKKLAQEADANAQNSGKRIIKSTKKNINTTANNAISDNSFGKVAEKHADINATDYGINNQNKPIIIDDTNDVVVLNTPNATKVEYQKIPSDSDLFDKNTKFTNPNSQTTDLQEPIVISETNTANNKIEEQKNYKETPVVSVPEITIPANYVQENQIANNTYQNSNINKNEEYMTFEEYQQAPDLDKDYVKEKLAKVLNEIAPINSSNREDTEKTVENTLKDAKTIKAERKKLKEDKQLTKQQVKAEKKRIKESFKLQKEQTEALISKHKSDIKAEKNLKKAKIKEEEIKIQQDAKLQKAIDEEQAKLIKFKEQNDKKHKSWVSSQIKKFQSQKASLEEKVAKEQAKTVQANDETKIQRLKARLLETNKTLSKEEQIALQEKYKADKAEAKAKYKAKQAEKKAALKSEKNKNSKMKNFFSKMKFWDKNK